MNDPHIDSSEAVARRCSVKGVLKNIAKFIEKLLCWSLLQKRLMHRSFPVNFAKFLRTTFS